MNIKYLLGACCSIPFLPFMYLQAKKIRKVMPSLPEAKDGEGLVNCKEGSRTMRILCIGESTIAGVGVSTHEEGFAGAFARELAQLKQANIAWKVYARTGYTAQKVYDRLLPKIQEPQVDVIVIGLGANDAFTLNSPRRWNKAIEEIIEGLQAKYPDAQIVFCNMPPIKAFPAFTPLIKLVVGNLIELLGAELEQTVSKYDDVFYYARNLTLEDWIERLNIKGAPEDFFSDGVHPSKLTYQTWAKDLVREINQRAII